MSRRSGPGSPIEDMRKQGNLQRFRVQAPQRVAHHDREAPSRPRHNGFNLDTACRPQYAFSRIGGTGNHDMRSPHLLKLLARIVALPVIWGFAIASGSAAAPGQNQTDGVQPRAETPPDRLEILRSLLGKDVVPFEMTNPEDVMPDSAPRRMAGDSDRGVVSPPPPSPPP